MSILGGLFTGQGGQGGTTYTNSTTNSGPTGPYAGFETSQLGTIQDLSQRPFQPYNVADMFAPLNVMQQGAFGNIQSLQLPAINPAYAAAGSQLNNYAGYNPITAAQPAFARASSGPTALEAAQPYTSAAAQTWPGASAGYLNPYIEGTVNAANKLQAENFERNIMPALNSQFVASGGGLGSKQYGNTVDWALTNLNNSIGNTTQGALANAYNSAAGIFGSDQARLAGLSGTVGNQATAGMGALTGLGSAIGANTIGGMGAGAGLANAYENYANNYVNTGLNAANNLLSAGTQAQQNAQLPLTAAYQQFQQQQQWPFQTTGWAADTANKYQWPQSSNTQSVGQTYGSSSSSNSPFGTLLGGLAAVGSLAIPGAGGVSAIGNILGGLGSLGETITAAAGPAGGYQFGFPAGGANPVQFARGGYFGLDTPSTPPTVSNPGYFKWMEPYAFAAGGVVPVINVARSASARSLRSYRAKQARPQGGVTRPLALPSTPGFFGRA